MKPFDFQNEFVYNIRQAFRKSKRVIGQLATGGGKGVVIALIAQMAVAKGNVVCISCHRIEIFEQLFKNLVSFGMSPGLIAAGQHPMPGSQVYLSMVETVCRRMDKGLIDKLNINFFILDEVHYGSYYKLIEKLDCNILGFTATPKSTGNPELNEYFDSIVCGIPIAELIRIGRLVPTVTYSILHDFSKVKMKGKDFDERSLFAEFKKPKLWDGAVKNYLEHAKGMQALCYCVNVEHSNATTLQFRDKGIRAAHVDGSTDKETRSSIFKMYRDGNLDVICNVGIATVGTDLPDTECVIQNFATKSLVKHVQTLGRGARCAEGKKRFITIDMGRNYARHKEFGEHIDWEYIFNNPSSAFSKTEKREKRECDECGAVMRFHLQVCPFCGDLISKKEIEKKLLVDATAEEVKAYRLKSVPPHLRKPFKEMDKSELYAYSKIMCYNPKWVHLMLKINSRNN